MAADYKIVNIKELEDMAVKFGLSPNVEARFGRSATDAKQGGFSYQKLAPDFRMPFGHTHGEQEEVYVVLGGSGRIKLDEEVVELAEWDAVRVPGDVARALEAGADGMEILAIGAPLANDTEMLQGWWS